VKQGKKRNKPLGSRAIDYAAKRIAPDGHIGLEQIDDARYYGLIQGYLAGFRACSAQRAARKAKPRKEKCTRDAACRVHTHSDCPGGHKSRSEK
jgi:hypothetical protein